MISKRSIFLNFAFYEKSVFQDLKFDNFEKQGLPIFMINIVEFLLNFEKINIFHRFIFASFSI